jgi:GNAT superfamily N-acetyltransferase
LPSEIQIVTVKTSEMAIELLERFFREEEFATPLSRIAENFDRMLVDPFCWSALAVDGETAQAVITVSTVLYVEWGRLGEIGDLYVIPEHRRKGLARRLVEHAKVSVPRAVRRSPSPSRQQASGGMGSVNSTLGLASRSPAE